MAFHRMGDVREYEKRIWKLVAFLGRYGHQPCDVCLEMETGDLRDLAEGVAGIMNEENEATRKAMDRG